jgi:hypothetical protein
MCDFSERLRDLPHTGVISQDHGTHEQAVANVAEHIGFSTNAPTASSILKPF